MHICKEKKKESCIMDEEAVFVPEENVPAEETPVAVEQPAAEPAPASEKPPRKTKLPLIIGGIAGAAVLCAVIAVVVLVVLPMLGSGRESVSEMPMPLRPYVTEDGEYCFVLPDGQCIEIGEDVKEAYMTPDREHIVVLLEDGTLYITDKEQSEEIEIADNCEGLLTYTNDLVRYYTQEETDGEVEYTYYRVLLKDYSVTEIDTSMNSAAILYETGSIMYSNPKGVWLMMEEDEEPTRIEKLSEDDDTHAELNIVVENGNLAVWTEVDEYNREGKIYIYEDGDKTKLTTFEGTYHTTSVGFTWDRKLLVIGNNNCNYLWLKTPGEEEIKVKLGGVPYAALVFTREGLLYDQDAASVSGLYVLVDSDSGYDVYYITMDGDRERVVSDVQVAYVFDGYMYYLDDEGSLHCAKVDEGELTDEVELKDDVYTFTPPVYGDCVFFVTDVEDYKGTLWAWKRGEEKPVKVKSGVSTRGMNISTDGKTVYYYKDVEYIGDTYYKQGTLMSYTYGDEEPVKISADVILGTPTSGIGLGLHKDGFVFARCVDDDDDTVYANIMHWNGKEAEKVVSDVVYD